MIHVNPVVMREYSDLFGEKIVNGRRIIVEELIVELAREFSSEIDRVIRARREWLLRKESVRIKGAFPSWDEKFADADGNVRTYREILQGLIDNFLGRDSEHRWGLNQRTPIPGDLDPLRSGLEITGPWFPMSRAIHQINADVVSMMEDEEDASPAWFIPSGSQMRVAPVWEARRIVKRVLAGDIPSPYYERGKVYVVKKDRSRWPAMIHRLPGIHLLDFDAIVDGKPVPAIITSLVIYVLNNYGSLKSMGRSVCFYLPKIQTPWEALVVEKIFRRVEHKLGLRIGEMKVAMLYEEANAGRYLPVIFWIFRERLIKSNNGRWDYLGSLIEMYKDEAVFPDPQAITMTHPIMMVYQRYNALITLMAGIGRDGKLNAAPVGGMAAVMLYQPTDPYSRHIYNARALRAIWIDKLRERLTGLIFVPDGDISRGVRITLDDILKGRVRGRLYDLFRQSWVATPEESYVSAGNKPLRADLEELQGMINRPVSFVKAGNIVIPSAESGLTDSERRLFQSLGLIDENGRITPWIIRRDMIDTPEKLLENPELWGGKDLWSALYEPPRGDITVEHVQHAFYMAANYGFQVLNGNLAAAIDDYELGQRFMNDLATYRIFVSWLWTLIRHRAMFTRAGSLKGPGLTELGVIPVVDRIRVEAGTAFTEELFERLWELHYEWTWAFYNEFDTLAARRIVERISPSKMEDRSVIESVKNILSRAYSSGPFRELSAREAAKEISEVIGGSVDEIEKIVVETAPRFDRSFAKAIMEILRKQLTSSLYIQHSSRVLFTLAPLDEKQREQVLDAIFSPREHVAKLIDEGKLSSEVLKFYDYIHDLR
jgi:malate synthase